MFLVISKLLKVKERYEGRGRNNVGKQVNGTGRRGGEKIRKFT
jgi:hypothetical protein